VDFLRQMKKKYGQSILRILYVTLDAWLQHYFSGRLL
jgi:hypothetical protein